MDSTVQREEDRADALHKALLDARHQVKNSFQNVISYINVFFVGKSAVDFASLNRLIRYIRVVTAFNDIVLANLEHAERGAVVALDAVLASVINANARKNIIHTGNFPPMYGAPRFAATLSLVFHELLEHVAEQSDERIEITVEQESETLAALVVKGTPTAVGAAKAGDSTGLHLIEVLISSEFCSRLERTQEGQRFSIKCKFPFQNKLEG